MPFIAELCVNFPSYSPKRDCTVVFQVTGYYGKCFIFTLTLLLSTSSLGLNRCFHGWNYLKFVKNISESASNPAAGYIHGTDMV